MSAINEAYFTSVTSAINVTNDCVAFNRISSEATAAVSSVISDMTSRIALLTPMLTPPGASIGSIVTWITNYIALIQGPVTELTGELATLTARLATLTAAINAKRAQLGC